MANKKESFVLFKSFYAPCSELSLEEKGLLFDALFEYQIDGKEPEKSNPIWSFFQFFKNQFRLDAIKYAEVCKRNQSNGANGGRPSKSEEPKQSEVKPKNPVGKSKPKKADKDKDNEKDNVNDTEKENEKVNTDFLRIKNLVSSEFEKWALDEFAEIWLRYLSMRKTAHKFTFIDDEMELRAIRKLWGLSAGDLKTATEIVKESLLNKWKGLFEMKNSGNNGTYQQKKPANESGYTGDIKF